MDALLKADSWGAAMTLDRSGSVLLRVPEVGPMPGTHPDPGAEGTTRA